MDICSIQTFEIFPLLAHFETIDFITRPSQMQTQLPTILSIVVHSILKPKVPSSCRSFTNTTINMWFTDKEIHVFD